MQKVKFKQTEIGKIPEDWEVKELGEVAEIVGGGTPSTTNSNFWNGNIPWITPKDLSDFKERYIDQGERKITQNGLDSSGAKLLPKDTVLLTTRAPVGYLAIANREVTTNQGFRSLIPNRETTSEFLFYLLKKNVDLLKANSTGTTFGEISGSRLKSLKFAFPPLPTQRRIAAILSSLDAKIELNNKMNKTLEAIGQALFKKWFIDERKDGWEEGKLGDLIDNVKKSLKPENDLSNRKYVPIDNLPMRKIGLDSYLPSTEAKSSLVGFEKDDILLGAMRVYFHRVNLSPFLGITRTTTFVLRPKNKENLSFCLFLLNMNETIDFANAHSKGSTMPYAVWNNSLENMPINIPDETTLKEFNKLVYPIISKIRDTIFENQKLSQIRDALLPKLMNGEIRVK